MAVVNAFLETNNSTAVRLFESGVALVEDIDRAFMIVLGVPRGPFAMLDHVGLDTVWHIVESNARRFQPASVQMLLLRERAERHPSDRSPDELRR